MNLALAWAAVAGVVVVLAYRWRRRVALLCLLVAVTGPALVVAVVASGPVVPELLVRASMILVVTVVLTVLAVLLTTVGLARLVSRHDRHGAAVACGMLAAMYGAVALFLAVAAAEVAGADALPVLRDRDAFVAWRDAPQGAVLLDGVISGLSPELDPPGEVVAAHACLTVDGRRLPVPGHRLPERYLVDFPGGPPVVVEGIDSGTQAWNWPAATGECVLRRGDRVVVWGQLQAGMGGGTTSYTGLADVRLIAAGAPGAFLDSYLPAARHTGRAVLALAALNSALAIAVVALGLRTYRRLVRTGTDAPAKITWRSGPR
ncbi:MAG: hypothetical protein SW019_17560 [Actinomycetota bacterium]|nr:hypothetical protein [Actinomycetota bacterium]